MFVACPSWRSKLMRVVQCRNLAGVSGMLILCPSTKWKWWTRAFVGKHCSFQKMKKAFDYFCCHAGHCGQRSYCLLFKISLTLVFVDLRYFCRWSFNSRAMMLLRLMRRLQANYAPYQLHRVKWLSSFIACAARPSATFRISVNIIFHII